MIKMKKVSIFNRQFKLSLKYSTLIEKDGENSAEDAKTPNSNKSDEKIENFQSRVDRSNFPVKKLMFKETSEFKTKDRPANQQDGGAYDEQIEDVSQDKQNNKKYLISIYL